MPAIQESASTGVREQPDIGGGRTEASIRSPPPELSHEEILNHLVSSKKSSPTSSQRNVAHQRAAIDFPEVRHAREMARKIQLAKADHTKAQLRKFSLSNAAREFATRIETQSTSETSARDTTDRDPPKSSVPTTTAEAIQRQWQKMCGGKKRPTTGAAAGSEKHRVSTLDQTQLQATDRSRGFPHVQEKRRLPVITSPPSGGVHHAGTASSTTSRGSCASQSKICGTRASHDAVVQDDALLPESIHDLMRITSDSFTVNDTTQANSIWKRKALDPRTRIYNPPRPKRKDEERGNCRVSWEGVPNRLRRKDGIRHTPQRRSPSPEICQELRATSGGGPPSGYYLAQRSARMSGRQQRDTSSSDQEQLDSIAREAQASNLASTSLVRDSVLGGSSKSQGDDQKTRDQRSPDSRSRSSTPRPTKAAAPHQASLGVPLYTPGIRAREGQTSVLESLSDEPRANRGLSSRDLSSQGTHSQPHRPSGHQRSSAIQLTVQEVQTINLGAKPRMLVATGTKASDLPHREVASEYEGEDEHAWQNYMNEETDRDGLTALKRVRSIEQITQSSTYAKASFRSDIAKRIHYGGASDDTQTLPATPERSPVRSLEGAITPGSGREGLRNIRRSKQAGQIPSTDKSTRLPPTATSEPPRNLPPFASDLRRVASSSSQAAIGTTSGEASGSTFGLDSTLQTDRNVTPDPVPVVSFPSSSTSNRAQDDLESDPDKPPTTRGGMEDLTDYIFTTPIRGLKSLSPRVPLFQQFGSYKAVDDDCPVAGPWYRVLSPEENAPSLSMRGGAEQLVESQDDTSEIGDNQVIDESSSSARTFRHNAVIPGAQAAVGDTGTVTSPMPLAHQEDELYDDFPDDTERAQRRAALAAGQHIAPPHARGAPPTGPISTTSTTRAVRIQTGSREFVRHLVDLERTHYGQYIIDYGKCWPVRRNVEGAEQRMPPHEAPDSDICRVFGVDCTKLETTEANVRGNGARPQSYHRPIAPITVSDWELARLYGRDSDELDRLDADGQSIASSDARFTPAPQSWPRREGSNDPSDTAQDASSSSSELSAQPLLGGPKLDRDPRFGPSNDFLRNTPIRAHEGEKLSKMPWSRGTPTKVGKKVVQALRDVSPTVKKAAKNLEKFLQGQTDEQLAFKRKYWTDEFRRPHLRDEILPLEQVIHARRNPGRHERPWRTAEDRDRSSPRSSSVAHLPLNDSRSTPPSAGATVTSRHTFPKPSQALLRKLREDSPLEPIHDNPEMQRRLARRQADIARRHSDEVMEPTRYDDELTGMTDHVPQDLMNALQRATSSATEHKLEFTLRRHESDYMRGYKKSHGRRLILEDAAFRDHETDFRGHDPFGDDVSEPENFHDEDEPTDRDVGDKPQQWPQDPGPEHALAETVEPEPDSMGGSEQDVLRETRTSSQGASLPKDKGKQRNVTPEEEEHFGGAKDFIGREERETRWEVREVSEDGSDGEREMEEAQRRSRAHQGDGLRDAREESSASAGPAGAANVATGAAPTASSDRRDTLADDETRSENAKRERPKTDESEDDVFSTGNRGGENELEAAPERPPRFLLHRRDSGVCFNDNNDDDLPCFFQQTRRHLKQRSERQSRVDYHVQTPSLFTMASDLAHTDSSTRSSDNDNIDDMEARRFMGPWEPKRSSIEEATPGLGISDAVSEASASYLPSHGSDYRSKVLLDDESVTKMFARRTRPLRDASNIPITRRGASTGSVLHQATETNRESIRGSDGVDASHAGQERDENIPFSTLLKQGERTSDTVSSMPCRSGRRWRRGQKQDSLQALVPWVDMGGALQAAIKKLQVRHARMSLQNVADEHEVEVPPIRQAAETYTVRGQEQDWWPPTIDSEYDSDASDASGKTVVQIDRPDCNQASIPLTNTAPGAVASEKLYFAPPPCSDSLASTVYKADQTDDGLNDNNQPCPPPRHPSRHRRLSFVSPKPKSLSISIIPKHPPTEPMAAPNGMNPGPGAPYAPGGGIYPNAGHHNDVQYIWKLVDELSAALEINRRQYEELQESISRARPQQSQAQENGIVLVNGDTTQHSQSFPPSQPSSAAQTSPEQTNQIAHLTNQLALAQSQATNLQTSLTQSQSLLSTYEASIGETTARLRQYAYDHQTHIIALHAHYNSLLEQSRNETVQAQLVHQEWQAGLGRLATGVRESFREVGEGEQKMRRRLEGMKSENALLRRLAGWQEADDDSSSDDEDAEGGPAPRVKGLAELQRVGNGLGRLGVGMSKEDVVNGEMSHEQRVRLAAEYNS